MNYQSAVTQLGSRDSRKVGNNTYLERLGEDVIGLRLHSTYVLRFRANGEVTLNTGGWHSVTTKERMNWCDGIRVYAKDHVWYVSILRDGVFDSENVIEYEDGMTITI